ncbi:hypothetical protein D3C86_1331200 [compost metagenome]
MGGLHGCRGGGRRSHQRDACAAAEDGIDRQRLGGIERHVDHGGGQIALQRRDQDHVGKGWVGAAAGGWQQCDDFSRQRTDACRWPPDTGSGGTGRCRWWAGRLLRGTAVVAVEAFLAFASQETRHHARARKRRRPIAIVAVILGVDGLHHWHRHVQTGQIQKFERAHAEAGAVAQDRIQHRVLGRMFGQQLEALGDESTAGMVDDEAR